MPNWLRMSWAGVLEALEENSVEGQSTSFDGRLLCRVFLVSGLVHVNRFSELRDFATRIHELAWTTVNQEERWFRGHHGGLKHGNAHV